MAMATKDNKSDWFIHAWSKRRQNWISPISAHTPCSISDMTECMRRPKGLKRDKTWRRLFLKQNDRGFQFAIEREFEHEDDLRRLDGLGLAWRVGFVIGSFKSHATSEIMFINLKPDSKW